MGAFNHVRPLTWAALMADFLTAMGDAAANHGIFEVDLIFPHNAIYTPNGVMPIVFAVQNPELAVSKSLGVLLYWQLLQGDYPGNNTGNSASGPGHIIAGGGFNIFDLNVTSNEPHLFSTSINTASHPDGVWTLDWSLQLYKCSGPGGSARQLNPYNTLVFTTSGSGQAPDVVAATSSGICETSEAFAYNVTGETCEVSTGVMHVFGPTPTTNPCAVMIDPTAASSIAAAATVSWCAGAPNNHDLHPAANVTCPNYTPLASANAAGRSRMEVTSTLLMLLATLTGLIHLG